MSDTIAARGASIPTRQHAVVITAAGGPDVLRLRPDWPVPAPGPDEVLIKVAAAGINRHDCNQRAAGPTHELNPVPGLEAAGHIVACGADVARQRLGEAVIALTDGGSYAEYVVTDQALALPLPAGMDLLPGAALPEALFTAWFNFFDLMRLAPGEAALIHGGTSGVGTVAIQLLRALGHDVYATAGTAEKRDAALALGCSAVFDYAVADLAAQILSVTGTRGGSSPGPMKAIMDPAVAEAADRLRFVRALDLTIDFALPHFAIGLDRGRTGRQAPHLQS